MAPQWNFLEKRLHLFKVEVKKVTLAKEIPFAVFKKKKG